MRTRTESKRTGHQDDREPHTGLGAVKLKATMWTAWGGTGTYFMQRAKRTQLNRGSLPWWRLHRPQSGNEAGTAFLRRLSIDVMPIKNIMHFTGKKSWSMSCQAFSKKLRCQEWSSWRARGKCGEKHRWLYGGGYRGEGGTALGKA